MKLEGKKVLVTGGSGSLGVHLIGELLRRRAGKVVSLSRDEGLVRRAEQEINSSAVELLVGDITDPKAVKRAIDGVQIVYHTAAMKHVSIAEKNPREVLRINVLGILNVLDHANHVERFVNVSSDKVIGVMNCYGSSKLLAEYLVQETNNILPGIFLNVRCPNFLGSRGSVIDNWMTSIKRRNMIQVTDPDMTRYFIALPDAAKFIVDTSLRDDLSPSTYYYPSTDVHKFRLGDLSEAFVKTYGNDETEIQDFGRQTSEKMDENYMEEVGLADIRALERMLRETL